MEFVGALTGLLLMHFGAAFPAYAVEKHSNYRQDGHMRPIVVVGGWIFSFGFSLVLIASDFITPNMFERIPSQLVGMVSGAALYLGLCCVFTEQLTVWMNWIFPLISKLEVLVDRSVAPPLKWWNSRIADPCYQRLTSLVQKGERS